MTSQLALPFADDSDSRRQIRQLLNETLFVEAGAGTGKTSALVERYVELVMAGRSVDEIVAITFTEKAAAELRDRVRGEMETRLREQPGLAAIEEALDNLDRAQISTIHAFALTALRSFAAETGINPTFAIQDEVSADRRFEDAWRSYLTDLEADPVALLAINRILELGLSTGDLEKLARELWQNTATAELIAEHPLLPPDEPFPDLHDLRQRLVDLPLDRVDPADDLLNYIRGLVQTIEQLQAFSSADRDTQLATVAPKLNTRLGGTGRAIGWRLSGMSIDAARKATRQVIEELQAALFVLRSQALATVLPLVVRFVRAEALRRLRDGDLVFDDLILRLRNILHTDKSACRRLRARYATLMVDEFQDTDPLQTDIALAFAKNPDTGRLEPGRLFLVGDPKQSIYRFRRADMTIYARTQAIVRAAKGKAPVLSLNRRSRDVVLQFVNTVFARLIDVGLNPAVQPPYRPVYPHRSQALDGPAVAYIGEELNVPAKQARLIEAEQLAAYCREALTQGWQVEERDGSTVRPARYRDIAILVPTRSILQPLERSLAAAGVPYRIEGGSLVYATQEVRDLINCLTAIDDPSDEVAVVGALRSTAYSCSDVELASHRLAGDSFNYLSPVLDATAGRVSAALLDLRFMREHRHQGGLAGLVERFVATHPLVEGSLYDTANRNAFRRARFVIEQARAFEADSPASLRSFVLWLEQRAGEAILDHEGAGLDDDEDAVRVLTIHGAKGLEFPIVFIAGLGSANPNKQIPILGLDRTTEEIAVNIGTLSRGGYFSLGPVGIIQAQENLHRSAETARLLYVAATRARDHLVISLYRTPRNRESPAQRLVDNGAAQVATLLPALPPVLDAELPPFSGLEVDLDNLNDEEFAAARGRIGSQRAAAPGHQRDGPRASAEGRHGRCFGCS